MSHQNTATMQLGTFVVYLLLALTVSQCECDVTVTPERLEDGQRANFTIEVDLSHQFTTQFDISAQFADWNGQYQYGRGRTLMRFTSPQCSAYGDVTIIDCDAIRMRFKIIARNLRNVYSFTGPFGTMSEIAFKRPKKVQVVSNAAVVLNNVTMNEGEPFQMTRRLIGGWNHDVTFRWYATTERSPTPDAQINPNSYSVPNSFWNSFHYDSYNGSSLKASKLRVRDRGEYYCEATYNPSSVGTFRSQIVRIYVPGELPPENGWIPYTIGGIVAFMVILSIVAVSIIAISHKCCRKKKADKGATLEIYDLLVPDD